MKRLALVLVVVALLPGCSVFMAAKQPDEKNIDLFKVGTHRSMLLAEFGYPTASDEKDGKKHEIFSFIQGYSKGAKAGRALFHGVADVFTLGLWEIVGTPTESIFDGTQMAYEVIYDDDEKIETLILLKKK